jgi:hypothetical protein
MVIKANSPKIAKQIISKGWTQNEAIKQCGKNNATASAEKPLGDSGLYRRERDYLQVASEPQNNTAAPQSNFNL